MLKQDKVFYSSLIGILLNTVSFLMREHREVFLCPYLNPILWLSGKILGSFFSFIVFCIFAL